MDDDMKRVSSYKKGRQFEYRVRDELLKLGLIVFRTAKSSGKPRNTDTPYPPVDLIAFTRDGRVLFVECKAGKYYGGYKQKEMRYFDVLPGPYFLVTSYNLKEVIERIKEWINEKQ
jgi:hypothetical protein